MDFSQPLRFCFYVEHFETLFSPKEVPLNGTCCIQTVVKPKYLFKILLSFVYESVLSVTTGSIPKTTRYFYPYCSPHPVS